MAEEQEVKKPKKTALIKHRKSEGAAKPKKKVVVVRKKAKVAKAPRRVAVKTEEKPAVEEKPKTQRRYLGSSPREPSPFDRYAAEGKGEAAAGGSRPAVSKAAASEIAASRAAASKAAGSATGASRSELKGRAGPAVERDGQTRGPRRTGGAAERGQRVPGRPPSDRAAPRYGRSQPRPSGRGPASQGGFGRRDTRAKIGGRAPGPGFPRRGAPATEPPPTSEEAKPRGKRFYTKGKPVYQKKKEPEDKEKLFQFKKKASQRANPVPKEVSILEAITVSELAKKMNLKASELIGKLMEMGMMVTINQQIDAETAGILADEYGCKANVVSLYDETVIEEVADRDEDLKPRPPIVTVMGHVDHGKTKLLDAIRDANVIDTESGGITQHIGAYTTTIRNQKIVFLDTPGHEAFTAMRARGAKVTDIVVLVVAADDGVMPQTVEAINHAKEAKVPIVVAVNKIDLPDANPERVKQQLADYELLPEDWGGHTLYSEVSALKGEGIEGLLDNILLQAEMLELKANFDCRAQGRVLESKVDFGRGSVATVLVQKGSLSTGDSFIAGIYPGKIRAMYDDKGEKVPKATPSIPVEIVGLTGLPNAGDPFHVTESEKAARQIGMKRQELKKMENAQNVSKITLDNLYEQIQQGNVQELKVVVKGDVIGSVEAVQNALERLSTDEIRLVVIHASAGAINDNDVLLAAASNALVVGFHVRPTPSAQQLAEREKVDIRKYTVIYDAVDSIKSAMEGMLAPELKEEIAGTAEVRDTFKVPRVGTIAGSYVISGKVMRGALARLIRDGIEIYNGKISSLKRFKDDAREVESGFECGIGIENYNDLKVGDQIEVYQVREIAKKLDESRRDEGNTEKED